MAGIGPHGGGRVSSSSRRMSLEIRWPIRNITSVFPSGPAPDGKAGGTAEASAVASARCAPYASLAMTRRIVLTTFPHLRDRLSCQQSGQPRIRDLGASACRRAAALRLPTLVRTPGDPPSKRGSDPAAPLRKGEADHIRHHQPQRSTVRESGAGPTPPPYLIQIPVYRGTVTLTATSQTEPSMSMIGADGVSIRLIWKGPLSSQGLVVVLVGSCELREKVARGSLRR